MPSETEADPHQIRHAHITITDIQILKYSKQKTESLPHEIIDTAIPKDLQCKVDRYERILKVAVHDEIRVRQPDVIVMVDGVQMVVLALRVVLQPWIVPLLLQQELHFVFL